MGTHWLRKWSLLVLGVIAVGLGAVGVVVPLLPTTPFLLLAAACFMRSSDRLYGWLIRSRWLGDYLRNYREHRAMTLGAKISALTLLWGVIGYSAIMVVDSWWLRILLGAVATGVTAHLLCLRTFPRDRHRGRGGEGHGESSVSEARDRSENRCQPRPPGGGPPMACRAMSHDFLLGTHHHP